MQGRTFRGQSPDGTWHEGFLIRSPGVKNSRPGEGWYINSEQEPAYAHLVKPFTIGMNTTLTDGNGAPVFEGDILKDNRCGKDVIFAVRYGEYIDYGVGHIGFYAEFSENRKEFVEHGSALLPYVLVDDKSSKSAAARAKVMAKACYSEYEKFDVAKMEVISDE